MSLTQIVIIIIISTTGSDEWNINSVTDHNLKEHFTLCPGENYLNSSQWLHSTIQHRFLHKKSVVLIAIDFQFCIWLVF